MRRILLPLLALVMGLSLVNAAPAAAGGIASTIRDRYASLNTFQAEFTQYLKHRESGQQEKRQGTLIFKKPLLVNWQTRAPHAESLIISADEIWDYLPEEKVAYRYPHSLVDDSRSLIQIVTGQALLSKDFDVKDGGTQGALQILRLYPKNPSPQMIQADLYVDPFTATAMTCVLRLSFLTPMFPLRASGLRRPAASTLRTRANPIRAAAVSSIRAGI